MGTAVSCRTHLSYGFCDMPQNGRMMPLSIPVLLPGSGMKHRGSGYENGIQTAEQWDWAGLPPARFFLSPAQVSDLEPE